MDLRPYKHYKELAKKHDPKVVRLTHEDIVRAPGGMQAQYMRDLITKRFKEERGLIVTRWTHVYDTIGTSNPLLGLVYMRGDSTVTDYMEVWGLLGHNLRGEDEFQS
jgi:hypothetical protein